MSRKRKTVNRNRAALAARLAATGSSARPAPRRPADGVVIRTAGAADLDRVGDLCARAGAGLETGTVRAVEGGFAGAALYAGQVGGTSAFFSDVRRTLPDLSAESLRALFLRLTLVLVAEHEEAGIVGAAVSRPPAETIMEQLRLMQSRGSTAKDQMDVMLGGALRVSRVTAVAVDESRRRQGVGATLVEAAITPFAELGYSMIYGIIPPEPGLHAFSGSLGFTALPPGSALSLETVGVPVNIDPGPGEQIVYRDR